MSNFQEEMNKRLRRVCGITDDSLRVTFHEHLEDSYWSGDPDDTNHGATYYIEVIVWTHNDTSHPRRFKDREVTTRFLGLSDLMVALEKVEL